MIECTQKSILTLTASGGGLREATKKKEKNFTTVVNYGGWGQQILVCEPQKSAFFKANFPKKTC